jgi:ACT domain-containing protein
MGQAAVSLQYKYKITTFCVVDEVHDSHLPVLDLRAMMILGAFAPGYVKVKDRAPKVTALAADTSLYDSAEVTLTISLTVDRADFEPEELLPLMLDLTTRYIKKEE